MHNAREAPWVDFWDGRIEFELILRIVIRRWTSQPARAVCALKNWRHQSIGITFAA